MPVTAAYLNNARAAAERNWRSAPNLTQAGYMLTSKKVMALGFNFPYTIDDGIKDLAKRLSGIRPYPQ